MDLLGSTSELNIDNHLISTDNVGGLVHILDGERVLQGSGGDSVFSYKGPVNAVDLGSQIDDGSGVDVFHSEGGDNEF